MLPLQGSVQNSRSHDIFRAHPDISGGGGDLEDIMPSVAAFVRTNSRTGILLVCTLVLFGGGGCYYFKQGTTLISHQLSARPISRCSNDRELTQKERLFFAEIEKIRNFAFDTLGLIRNSSYTRYVHIDSSYLVAVLSIADSASLVPVKWCYPLFGCFPLRAYHDIADARKVGERFLRKGYEINIDKVDGFSTLGIFSDPLYSFMTDYPVFSLARFLFHEQMHATAYFRNVRFSEEVATFIGNEAALEYIKVYRGADSPEYCDALEFMGDQKRWVALLRQLYTDLDTVYHSGASRSGKIARRNEIVGSFRELLHNHYDSLFTTSWYRGAEKLSFNNAYLAVRMTYTLDLELFAQLLKKKGSLREVVLFVKQLKRHKGDPKSLLINEIEIKNNRR